jgi:peptidylprolyl isomerase
VQSPSYGETLEEQGRFQSKTVLPFNAYGTLAWAHPAEDVNGGADSFFALKFDPIYTPAGLNTLDGQYAVFGCVCEESGAFPSRSATYET